MSSHVWFLFQSNWWRIPNVRFFPPHFIQTDYDAPGDKLSPRESLGTKLNITLLLKAVVKMLRLTGPPRYYPRLTFARVAFGSRSGKIEITVGYPRSTPPSEFRHLPGFRHHLLDPGLSYLQLGSMCRVPLRFAPTPPGLHRRVGPSSRVPYSHTPWYGNVASSLFRLRILAILPSPPGSPTMPCPGGR